MPAPATAIFFCVDIYLLRARRVGRDEFAFAQEIIDAAPANGAARETGDPDAESDRVPQRDEKHFAPDAALLHAPDADHPGDQDAEEGVTTEVSGGDGERGVDGDGEERPREAPSEDKAEVSPKGA